MALLEGKTCPVCWRPLLGMLCQSCGFDLNVFNRLTAAVRLLLNQALEAMQAKAYVTALKLIEQGLRISPKDSELLLLAGLCHYALGDLAQADYCWGNSKNSMAVENRQKIAEDQDGFQWVYNRYHRAVDLLRAGKQRQAQRILMKSLRTGPQYLPALELLAQIFYDKRHYGQCRRTIRRIKAITLDAPLLRRLTPDLDTRVFRCRCVYALILLLLVTGGGCYGLKGVVARSKPVKTEVVYRHQAAPRGRFDREALRATARDLAERNDFLTSADILAAIGDRETADLGFTPEENMLLARAAVYYYYEGRHHFIKNKYDEAAVSFGKSRSYPVRSYVYDDTLYYHAIVKERLGAALPAVNLYQQLLREEPNSNYCPEAIIRWGQLARRHQELRPQYEAAAQIYPEFSQLIAGRVRGWKER
jgi:tetratricopeptide (TPR) repeat protein